MGLRAYACCLLVVKTGANPWLAAIFGMVVVGLVAGIVVLPALFCGDRISPLVSIAFGESIRQVIINSEFFRKGQRRGPSPGFLVEFPVCQQGSLTTMWGWP